mmetsp:Transcript_18963/g.26690  ORF Transcript_18963/g.26690 Transcript_18963/m.26690 type:complete len:431 (+) Transcript_18963:248-1540(+)|eukprot:CAMPEP_0184870682 /NCGR_PEP_ID=MMETSP0580-20130426/38424_1 /TAXON_ID=1118495 /ORGANISM="Dactyliosolen fragilissimus" /LENGTH=430 /DNA_ID=CAMNT_0027372905 /DNA_START=210 /DNA_END=1502 /DNA_ORIENTATION=-
MGCTSSIERPDTPPITSSNPLPTQASPVEDDLNDRINDSLILSRQEDEGKVKLLLLGAGESGKSTIFKQMRILYGSPRDEEELRMYGVVVRSNIIVAVRKLCRLLNDLGLVPSLEEESRAATMCDGEDASGMTPKQAYDELDKNLCHQDVIIAPEETTSSLPQNNSSNLYDWVGYSARAGSVANQDSKLFLKHVEAIRVLWQSPTMREVWSKRVKANVNDSHKEYLQDLTRIASADYRPTQQDILMSRVRTTQIIMERYHIDGVDFEMYDVGGQRSERRKWLMCFENVDAVIFVAALCEYDQCLTEAKRTNRMVEALELFRSVCNNRAFADTSIMLFLNKKDIFAEKILYSDIADQRPFSDFSGPAKDFDHGILYFIQKFKDCQLDSEFNDAFIHVTEATDTNNMEFVLDSSRTIIMTDNLRRSGFLGLD